MNTKTFVGWIVVAAILSLAIGIGIGGGFAMHQADGVLDAMHARDKADYDALKKNFDELAAENVQLEDALRQMNTTGMKLLDRVRQDEALCTASGKTLEGSLHFKLEKPQ